VVVRLLRLISAMPLAFGRIKPDQAESNQIKPAGWSVLRLLASAATPEGHVVVRLLRPIAAVPLALGESSRIKMNQTKSNLRRWVSVPKLDIPTKRGRRSAA
jgi:hypothetical protein